MNQTYAYSLVDLLRGDCDVPSGLDTRITGIATDSRVVSKGDLFIALDSDVERVKTHIEQAVELGANAILRDGASGYRVYEDKAAVEICLPDLRNLTGSIVSRFFQKPSEDLKVIGVTGTNGKTSVANYLAQYVSSGSKKCGVMGTLGFGLIGSEMVDTGFTTPDIVSVHRNLASMRDMGAEIVVMEVSSHALSQCRVDGVQFFGAVFTNLTRDHLDYHGSMDSYAETKQLLFRNSELKFAILNLDDAYFTAFKSIVAPSVDIKTYSRESGTADISILSQKLSSDGLQATLKSSFGQISISSKLLGEFNLYNLLAVIGAATALNDLADLEARIEKIESVPGRMQVIKVLGRPTVVVDYAHTPDALENVLQCLQGICEGKLRLIFGCGGDRDTGKRAEMAKVAERLASEIIVTDDNPRSEDPEVIMSDILEGFDDLSQVDVVHDRRAAISQSIAVSGDRDVVLIAGKGHENWQEVNGQRHYFNDLETVRELISEMQRTSIEKEAVHD